jgi:peptidyl-tRNA hydrolase
MPDPDPFVMYIVVRESLALSAGKVGAQAGHAVDYLWRDVHALITGAPTEVEEARLNDFTIWKLSEHGKIILRASDQEFEKVKAEEPDHFLVIDNGHTEVAPKTETCLGLWPRRKSARSATLKRLRLY